LIRRVLIFLWKKELQHKEVKIKIKLLIQLPLQVNTEIESELKILTLKEELN